jgi:hypothetical protein
MADDFELEDRVAKWRREADERTRQRDTAKAGLIYKSREQPAAVAAETRAGDDAWNAWLDARLEQERELMTEIIGEVVAKLRAERNDERSADVAAELNKLWNHIVDIRKELVALGRDRVERSSFRDVDPAKLGKVN